MEKRIVAFTYMILQLAKQYAENSLAFNDNKLLSLNDANKIRINNIDFIFVVSFIVLRK